MSTENLARAFAVTRGVLANVTPDDYGKPTPCESWDVRGLINHIVGGSYFFGASVAAGKSPEAEEIDFTEGDLLDSYDEGIASSVAAFGAPGALEKMVELPFGTMPAGVFINIATSDVFAHGWDLARATGQPTDLDPELAATLHEGMKPMLPDAMRGPDSQAPFGPVTEAPAGASAADQLAAFLGRKV